MVQQKKIKCTLSLSAVDLIQTMGFNSGVTVIQHHRCLYRAKVTLRLKVIKIE